MPIQQVEDEVLQFVKKQGGYVPEQTVLWGCGYELGKERDKMLTQALANLVEAKKLYQSTGLQRRYDRKLEDFTHIRVRTYCIAQSS